MSAGTKVDLRTVLLRSAAFSALWWVVAEGQVVSWPFAAVGVSLATFASFRVAKVSGVIVLRNVPRFAAYFLVNSLYGGIDVAYRAFHPRLPLRTGLVERTLSLDSDQACQLLVLTLSLLPGTLSTELRGRTLRVHALDVEAFPPEKLVELEAHVARLFPATNA
jgi:multicomponent Na+:H+ antiporter subunit E